jgi:hypothetical protein
MINARLFLRPKTNSTTPKNISSRKNYPNLNYATSTGNIISNLPISNTPPPISPRSILTASSIALIS